LKEETMKKVLVVFVGLVAVILVPVAATAHNAGHLFLPDGTCVEVGSFREAPLVGPDGTQLDLVPETPRDQLGVSFVGITRDTPIFPGGCPVAAPAVNDSKR
jgi:hypothetical protein